MYIQRYKRKKKDGKIYQSVFLVESYRENGKVKHRHLANLTALPESAILAVENDLKGIKLPTESKYTLDDLRPIQGKSCGAIFTILQLANRLGITAALGKSKEATLALIQIMGRIICQGSRNYLANEWKDTQALKEVLQIDNFDENQLYSNLDWLSKNQESIENKLFTFRNKGKQITSLYLYDVTSSYFEGTQNELAAFGYNRDGKKGKMQIVIGLLCDKDGYPISVEVFEGNTQDSSTVSNQLKKMKERFGVENVIVVGDRGMIKSTSIDNITELNWYYITAITKPQICTLLKNNVIQLEMFTEELFEIEDDGIRYVLRRNPYRAAEIEKNRQGKFVKLHELVKSKNEYLQQHPKAKLETALKNIRSKALQLKIHNLLDIVVNGSEISIHENEKMLNSERQMDGCYVIKSNVPKSEASSEVLHSRYKDLSMVETAFRTFKQSFEEIRPIYVRKEKRTRGHVFVCMLSYIIIKYAWEQCKELNVTQKHLFKQLENVQYIGYKHKNIMLKVLPKELLPETQQILDKLKIKLPDYL